MLTRKQGIRCLDLRSFSTLRRHIYHTPLQPREHWDFHAPLTQDNRVLERWCAFAAAAAYLRYGSATSKGAANNGCRGDASRSRQKEGVAQKPYGVGGVGLCCSMPMLLVRMQRMESKGQAQARYIPRKIVDQIPVWVCRGCNPPVRFDM